MHDDYCANLLQMLKLQPKRCFLMNRHFQKEPYPNSEWLSLLAKLCDIRLQALEVYPIVQVPILQHLIFALLHIDINQ